MQPPSAQFVSAKERSLAKEAIVLPDDLPPPGVCSVCGDSSDEIKLCLLSGSKQPTYKGLPLLTGRLICGALICPMCWEEHQKEPHVDPAAAAAA